jgi:hypothetical protein
MLAKLTDLKAWPGMPSDQDALLTLLLQAISERFAGETQRTLEYAVRTEIHDGGADCLWTMAPCIASITSIKEAYEAKWSQADELVENADFWMEKKTGRIWRQNMKLWLTGTRTVRIDYKGGWTDPVTPLPANGTYVPKTLQLACIQQVRFWWIHRNELGMTGISMGGANISFVSDAPLLKDVQREVNRYKRLGPPAAIVD